MNKRPVSYFQTDPRWKDKPYQVPGEQTTIGGSGCGPTCAAMLIETLTGKTFTPVDACKWSLEHGYKALNQGTYYGYLPAQFKAFGIACERLNGDNAYGKPKHSVHDRALRLLREGYYIIACMGKGLWTSSGHFVVVWWEDGKVRINDPASTREARVNGDPGTFRSQVKYYWAVDAREHNKEEVEDLTEEQIRRIVREEMAAVEAERAKLPASGWAVPHIQAAVDHGLMTENAAGSIDRPQAAVTRQELATVANAIYESLE